MSTAPAAPQAGLQGKLKRQAGRQRIVVASRAMAAFAGGADVSGGVGRASSVFEVLSEPTVPKCEVINDDVFAIRIDEDRLRHAGGSAATVVHCEFYLPAATPITSLWAALLSYRVDTKRKVLSDREDSTYFYDTYHAPWREVKVPVGSLVRTEQFAVSGDPPYIIAASLRGPSFPPHAVDKKKGLVAFSQVIGSVPGGWPDVKPECFVRRAAPTEEVALNSKRKLRGQPDAEWDKHTLKVGARRAALPDGGHAARDDSSPAAIKPETNDDQASTHQRFRQQGEQESENDRHGGCDDMGPVLHETDDVEARGHKRSRREDEPDDHRKSGVATSASQHQQSGVATAIPKLRLAALEQATMGMQSSKDFLQRATDLEAIYGVATVGSSLKARLAALEQEAGLASASQHQQTGAAAASVPLRLAALEEATMGKQSSKDFVQRAADLEAIYEIAPVGDLKTRLATLEQEAGL